MVTIASDNDVNKLDALESATSGNPVQQHRRRMHIVEVAGAVFFIRDPVDLEIVRTFLERVEVAVSTTASPDKVAHRHAFEAKYLTSPRVQLRYEEVMYFGHDVWKDSNVPLDLQGTPVPTWQAARY